VVLSNHSEFKTEAVCVPLQWRPPAAIAIECFASPLTGVELRTRGLHGATAIGDTPYGYLVHHLDRPQDEILGDIIDIGPEEGWLDLFKRLGGELTLLEPGFWDDLLRSWQERTAKHTGA
jgi:hypothetical protein